jgi:hypothetical protein
VKTELEALGEPYRSRARDGLQALRRPHRSSIDPADTRRLTGSVDLEACLDTLAPYRGAAKWDYGIGFRAPRDEERCAVWVEVHNATPGDLATMRAKLASLKRWLADEGRSLHAATEAGRQALGGTPFRWIVAGSTSVPASTRSFRAAAQEGLGAPERVLRLP